MRKAQVSTILILFTINLCGWAQAQSTNVPMADGLRSEGKIYVVVLSLLLIMAGIFAFLFRLERKLSRLEKQIQDHEN